MTTIINFLLYSYYFFAINYYRKEIEYRIADGFVSKKKHKAPLSLKKMVLFIFVITVINAILQINVGDSVLILINCPFVITLLLILKRYERQLRKIDKEFYQ